MDDESLVPIAMPLPPTEFKQPSIRIVSPSHSPTRPGWQVYTCGAIWALVIILIFILGILLYIPWLGAFAFLALIPGFFILWLIYWRKHRKEAILTKVVTWIAFGMIGLVPIAFAEFGINYGFKKLDERINVPIPWKYDTILDTFISSFVIAALCEESFKLIMAMVIPLRTGMEVPYSFVIYSAAGAIGLATLENIIYVLQFGITTKSPIVAASVAITRAFLAVPLHVSTGVIIGSDVARRKFQIEMKHPLRILFIPVLIHGIYDFCTIFIQKFLETTGNLYIISLGGVGIVTVIFAIIYARRKAKAVMSDEAGYMPLTSIQSP